MWDSVSVLRGAALRPGRHGHQERAGSQSGRHLRPAQTHEHSTTLTAFVATAWSKACRRHEIWIYSAWFQFLIRYRRTLLGPIWLLVGPTLFIVTLGFLFSEIGQQPIQDFVPHLTIGLVVWTLISESVTGSTNVFQANRARVLQTGLDLNDIVMVRVVTVVLLFLHQAVLIVAVMVFFGVPVTLYSLVSLVGLTILIINGIWLTHLFGALGARYRDLAEVVNAVMRIAFLATPIIWMPADHEGRGTVMTAFLAFNPFHHYLELIRAPLLGQPIAMVSWIVVLVITTVGIVLAAKFHQRFGRYIPLWV